MNLTMDIEDAALELLRRGETHAAHLALANHFDHHPGEFELMQIANLIHPCAMFSEAMDALQRRKLAAYAANRPADADIGRTVPAGSTVPANN